jgi:hypothetical protein
VASARWHLRFPSAEPNCRLNPIHSHAIRNLYTIYFFGILPSTHGAPKSQSPSPFPIKVCTYLQAKSVNSHCRSPFSHKATPTVQVTVKKHLHLASDRCVFTWCHHPDHVLPSLADRHTSSKRDAVLIPCNNNCQLPPTTLHSAIIYKNDSVIQLIASTPRCFRGPYPAVRPESACDLDDDGLQCLIQQLVWHWGSPPPASCHPHQAVCLAVQGSRARGLETRAHTKRGQLQLQNVGNFRKTSSAFSIFKD